MTEGVDTAVAGLLTISDDVQITEARIHETVVLDMIMVTEQVVTLSTVRVAAGDNACFFRGLP